MAPPPPPRDTTTGGVLEGMVPMALKHGGYTLESQKFIGAKLGGHRHKVDIVATKDGHGILVSLKWQQTSGTAEEKIPFEVMCLADAVQRSEGRFERAYVVLGGDGWTLRDFYVGGKMDAFLKNCEMVKILTMETFIARANKGDL